MQNGYIAVFAGQAHRQIFHFQHYSIIAIKFAKRGRRVVIYFIGAESTFTTLSCT